MTPVPASADHIFNPRKMSFSTLRCETCSDGIHAPAGSKLASTTLKHGACTYAAKADAIPCLFPETTLGLYTRCQGLTGQPHAGIKPLFRPSHSCESESRFTTRAARLDDGAQDPALLISEGRTALWAPSHAPCRIILVLVRISANGVQLWAAVMSLLGSATRSGHGTPGSYGTGTPAGNAHLAWSIMHAVVVSFQVVMKA